MQFESIVLSIFAVAILLFLVVRRNVITDLKEENEELTRRANRLRDVADRQRNEITKLIQAADDERRARQLATLANAGMRKPDSPLNARPANWKSDPDLARDPYKYDRPISKPAAPVQPVNTWEDHHAIPAAAQVPATPVGGGGTFDGGGASGDYSSSCSDSTSSSSSDSSSCSSND